jgi:hypothetical protein
MEITSSRVAQRAPPRRAGCGRALPVDYVRGFYPLQLVAEHDIRARGGDLMKNVKAVGQYRFPVTHARLLNNQINSAGLAPFL